MENGKKTGKIRWGALILDLAIPQAVGAFSAYVTRGATRVYKTLTLPPLAPPGWVFPVAWTTLFLLMGVACYLVWEREAKDEAGRKRKRTALLVYSVQLGWNFVWTLIFWNAASYGLALLWLVGLWLLVLAATVLFWREREAAGWLMLPTLLWVAFAGYLNAGIWLLN